MGDLAHSKRKSDHNSGNAFDLTHDPKNGPNGNVLTRELVDANDPRVTYIIWNKKIWTKAKGWKAYTGSNPHNKHFHVSIKPESRDDLRPWPWTPGASKALSMAGTLVAGIPLELKAETTTNEEGDTSAPAPPKPENAAPQDVVLQPTTPDDKTSKKSLWTMIIAVPGLVITWITTNIGEAMGFLKDREITKWLIIIGGTLAGLYLLRQILGKLISEVGAILYNLKSMQYHADPTTNNVKLASPAPREEVKA